MINALLDGGVEHARRRGADAQAIGRLRTFNGCCWSLVSACPLVCGGFWHIGEQEVAGAVFAQLIYSVATLLGIRRGWHFERSVYACMALFALMLGFLCQQLGGIGALGLEWLFIVVAYAGLVLGSRGAITFAIVAMAQLLIFAALDGSGYEHAFTVPTDVLAYYALLVHALFGATLLAFVLAFQSAQRQANEALLSGLRARDAAEKKVVEKSTFLACMSHEIRTPLNGVLGLTELALATPFNDIQRDYLDTSKKSAESLLRLLNDILEYSKLEAGRAELSVQPLSLRAMVEDTIRPCRAQAQGQGLRLELELGPAIPDHLLGDAGRIQQVLQNLLGNALKFTPKGGVTLRVSGETRGPGSVQLCFSVIDTGVGILPQAQEHIFQAFAQVDQTATRAYGGTGIGLSIAKQLVELMGGHIWVESTVGQGSAFHFTVELGLAPAELVPPPRPAEAPSSQAPARRLSVLVAEDNRVNQLVMRRLLEARGHQVTVVEDGLKAIESLQVRAYDLILMDIEMPHMDGVSATRAIRAQEQVQHGQPHIPIIAVTANAMDGDKSRYLAAGIDAYHAKPVQATELLRTMDILVSRPPPARL